MNVYMSGTMVRSAAAFADDTGAAADPSSVVLKYKKGAGSTTTVTYPSSPIVKDATGGYHANFDTTGWAGPDSLRYVAQWQGTGTVQAIGSDEWDVTPPAL